jgi:hypothetical protein
MQDWITDSHDTFHQALKTATQLHAEEFITCTTCEQQPWVSFFFDGTGNNRKIDEPKKKLSNVARLYEGHDEERPLVWRFYYPGVGTPLDVIRAGGRSSATARRWAVERDSVPMSG